MRDTWSEIQKALEKGLNPGIFTLWIKPLGAQISGSTLELIAPNEFVATWVRERLLDNIAEAASLVMGQAPAVVVRTGAVAQRAEARPLPGLKLQPALPAGKKTDGAADVKPAASSSPGRNIRRIAEQSLGLPLLADPNVGQSWRFSFDDFVVGPSNELAYAAARSVCRSEVDTDHLFLCSTPGLGKTHLLQAIGQQLGESANRRARVRYLTAEQFANQMVMAIKSGETASFKARFRENVDILLLEDVHFLQNKARIQDELLATLKALRERGSRVVFTSSFLPRELAGVDDHLASRFASGFLAPIEKPDFETRRRIVAAKAGKMQCAVPGEVSELLADRITTDIRLLESCIRNLVVKAKLLNRGVSLDMARQVLATLALDRREPGIDSIVEAVCRTFALSADELGSKSRKRQIVIARNTAFFLARKYTELSLKDIGMRFNRRHSTVLKGITNLEREISRKTPLGSQIKRTMEILEKENRA